jgi:hypothetical protein
MAQQGGLAHPPSAIQEEEFTTTPTLQQPLEDGQLHSTIEKHDTLLIKDIATVLYWSNVSFGIALGVEYVVIRTIPLYITIDEA